MWAVEPSYRNYHSHQCAPTCGVSTVGDLLASSPSRKYLEAAWYGGLPNEVHLNMIKGTLRLPVGDGPMTLLLSDLCFSLGTLMPVFDTAHLACDERLGAW